MGIFHDLLMGSFEDTFDDKRLDDVYEKSDKEEEEEEESPYKRMMEEDYDDGDDY